MQEKGTNTDVREHRLGPRFQCFCFPVHKWDDTGVIRRINGPNFQFGAAVVMHAYMANLWGNRKARSHRILQPYQRWGRHSTRFVPSTPAHGRRNDGSCVYSTGWCLCHQLVDHILRILRGTTKQGSSGTDPCTSWQCPSIHRDNRDWTISYSSQNIRLFNYDRFWIIEKIYRSKKHG